VLVGQLGVTSWGGTIIEKKVPREMGVDHCPKDKGPRRPRWGHHPKNNRHGGRQKRWT